MPIAVRCKCGHAMNVPDSAAGKVGKCPKCQQPIKVPAATSAPKATATVQKSPAAAPSGMDKLFNEAGVGVRKGPACPACDSPVAPNSAICIHCGYHFERGERMQGSDAVSEGSKFGNMYLDEAAENMALDKEAERRVTYAGAPWWVTLGWVLAIMTLIFAGAVKVQAVTTQNYSKPGTLMFAFQAMPVVTLIPFIGMIISAMVYAMSRLAVLVKAFQDSVAQGFLVWFVPFYSYYYAIANWKRLHTTAKVHIFSLIVVIGFTSWFLGNHGLRFIINPKPIPKAED